MERATPKPRVNDTAVARFEAWALPRMAARLPTSVTPDRLTAVGLVGALMTATGYLLAGREPAWLWLASAGFVVHWWGDSLDGTLARVRDIRRERYGYFVDQLADVIAVLLIFSGLGAGGALRPLLAMGMALGYLLLFNLVNMVAVARGVYKISFAGGGPTELRLMLIVVNTVAWALWPRTFRVAGEAWAPFELFALAAIPILLLLFFGSAFREWRLLAALDPRPAPGTEPGATPADSVTSSRTS